MVPRRGVARLGVIALLPAGLVFGCGHSAPEAQSSKQHSAVPASAPKRQDPTWENIRRIIAQRINVPEEKVIPTARFEEDFNAAEPDMEDMIEGFDDAFDTESEPDDPDMLITVQDAIDYINSPVTFRREHAGQSRYSDVRDPYPTDVKYSKADAWVRVEGNTASIGVTYAFQQRGAGVGMVHLPQVGKKLAAGDIYATIDVGMAGDVLHTPVSGVITEVNSDLASSGRGINKNPYAAWIIKVDLTNPKELDALLSAAEYAKFVAGN
jgi:glycine cleavage system H protein